MGIRARINRIYQAAAGRTSKPSLWDNYWYQIAGQLSKAGVEITEHTSLNLSSVWCAVRSISETIGTLPLITYEQKGRKKERAKKHPVYDLLHIQPNPEMTASQYRTALQAHLLTWGNHYSQIETSYGGTPLALWPLDPSRMKVTRPQKEIIYQYSPLNGEIIDFPSREILHITGLGFNGLMGYSVIQHHRDSIGLAMAGEIFQSRLFKNNATPSGTLSTEFTGDISDEKIKKLLTDWYEAQGGLDNIGKVAFLTHGLKFQPIGMPLKDVEFLGLRRFQIEEICRIFNISPHFLQDWERSTFSNVEQDSINHVIYCLRPWMVFTEQAMMVKLLSKEERRTVSIEHLVEGLLRGDTLSRYNSYQSGINSGWMTRNEAREKENYNPLEGLDEPLIQGAMKPADEAGLVPDGLEKETKIDKDGKNGEDKEMQKKLYEYMSRTTRELGDIRKRLNIAISKKEEKDALSQ